MAEGANIGTLLLGGLALGVVGYYIYMRDKPCQTSIFGGETTQYECALKTLVGCKWNGTRCVSAGENPDPPPGNVPCFFPDQTYCFDDSPGEGQPSGPNKYKCVPDVLLGHSWGLMQSGSTDCNSPVYHKKCFQFTTDGYHRCKPTLGETADACWSENTTLDCQCSPLCQTSEGYCCDDNICHKIYNGVVTTFAHTDCSEVLQEWPLVPNTHTRTYIYTLANGVYPLNRPITANSVSLQIQDDHGPWNPGLNMKVYLHYVTDGNEDDIGTWQEIYNFTQWGTCPCNENLGVSNFGTRCIDKIAITFSSMGTGYPDFWFNATATWGYS
jgi:hypothetical protein